MENSACGSNLNAKAFGGRRALCGTTNVTTDANGKGRISFPTSFRDDNVFFLVGLTDKNMVDRYIATIQKDGVDITLYLNGSTVKNANGWIQWIAVGSY